VDFSARSRIIPHSSRPDIPTQGRIAGDGLQKALLPVQAFIGPSLCHVAIAVRTTARRSAAYRRPEDFRMSGAHYAFYPNRKRGTP
jgi:hypothetical protein